MITSPPIEETIAHLNASIQFWQKELFWFTGLAALSGIIVAISELKLLSKWRRAISIVFGVVSGIFWVMTIVCAWHVNRSSSRVQYIYITQTEQAERQVEVLQSRIKILQDSEKSTALGVLKNHSDWRAVEKNENEIRDFRVDVSYKQNFFAGPQVRKIVQDYYMENSLPRIECDGFNIPLIPEVHEIIPNGNDSHVSRTSYALYSPENLVHQPIQALDKCHLLIIPFLMLEVDETNGPNDYFSIPYLDAQFVVNGFPLTKIHMQTSKHWWIPRYVDNEAVVWKINDTFPHLSQQYFQRHSR